MISRISMGVVVFLMLWGSERCFGAETHDSESAPQVMIEWRFDQAGNLLGWVPGGHVADVAVQDGGLSGRATDWDPILMGPVFWRLADERTSGLEYIPIVDTGWTSQPWHGQQAGVIHGRTPELFGQRCRLRPPGDWPPSLVPADVGRGPYDLQADLRKTAWQFDIQAGLQGWRPNGALQIELTERGLQGRSVGNDPILHAPGVRFAADEYQQLVVRMSSSQNDVAQLFWATTITPVSEANSIRFPVIGDGNVHEYRVDLTKSPRWRGTVTGLRFDPVMRSGVDVVIETIRLEP